MLRRGWSDDDVAGLLGENVLRVLDGADRTAQEMATMPASAGVLDARTDLPCEWGGPGGAYLAKDVQAYLRRRRDEL
jgi:membrane dipeptidase